LADGRSALRVEEVAQSSWYEEGSHSHTVGIAGRDALLVNQTSLTPIEIDQQKIEQKIMSLYLGNVSHRLFSSIE